MRIAYITNSSERSGVGYRALQIKHQIRRSGEDIKIYDFHLDGARGLLSKEGRPIGRVSTPIGLLKKKPINWIRLGRKFKQYVKTKDKRAYDLWHLTNQSLSFLANRATAPVIITVHDIIELTQPQQPGSKYLNKYLLSGIKRAKQIIAVSEHTAQEIKIYFGLPDDKVTVIYNGSGAEWKDIENYRSTIGYLTMKKKLGIAEGIKIILFVGSDHPRKNALQAVDVLGQLVREGQPVMLIKVGEAGILTERGKLLAKIDQMGLRDKVRFVDNVSQEELHEIYNVSDVLLFPSTNEGFGLPLVQAMAARLAIVAVRATATPEIVGDAAIMCEPDDTASLTSSVREVLNNEALRESLKAKGAEQVKKFNWNRAAEQEVEVYKRALWPNN